MRKLSEALKSIPSARPLSKWTGALQELVNERGVLRVAPGGVEEAWKALNASPRPETAAKIDALLAEAYATPKDVLARAAKAISSE